MKATTPLSISAFLIVYATPILAELTIDYVPLPDTTSHMGYLRYNKPSGTVSATSSWKDRAAQFIDNSNPNLSDLEYDCVTALLSVNNIMDLDGSSEEVKLLFDNKDILEILNTVKKEDELFNKDIENRKEIKKAASTWFQSTSLTQKDAYGFPEHILKKYVLPKLNAESETDVYSIVELPQKMGATQLMMWMEHVFTHEDSTSSKFDNFFGLNYVDAKFLVYGPQEGKEDSATSHGWSGITMVPFGTESTQEYRGVEFNDRKVTMWKKNKDLMTRVQTIKGQNIKQESVMFLLTKKEMTDKPLGPGMAKATAIIEAEAESSDESGSGSLDRS